MRIFILKLLRLVFLLILSQTILIVVYFKCDFYPIISSTDKEISSSAIYILGNSHSQCAINDELLPSEFINISQSSEPLFYTCAKARYILEKGMNDTIVIEFTNISPLTTDWVLGEGHFVRNLKRYAKKIDFFQHEYLFKKSPGKYIKSIMSLSLFDFLEMNRIDGGYKKLERFEISNEVVNFENRWIPNDAKMKSFSDQENKLNFMELKRLINEFPKTHFILIRSPMHISFEYFEENHFLRQVKELSNEVNVDFFDFSHEVTNNSLFGDAEHLNYLGANYFTPVFIEVIRKTSSK